MVVISCAIPASTYSALKMVVFLGENGVSAKGDTVFFSFFFFWLLFCNGQESVSVIWLLCRLKFKQLRRQDLFGFQMAGWSYLIAGLNQSAVYHWVGSPISITQLDQKGCFGNKR